MAESSMANEVKPEAPAPKQPGPADDIRMIQQLLVNGIFPGQVAPQVVRSYQLLESMAVEIEKSVVKADAPKPEVKA